MRNGVNFKKENNNLIPHIGWSNLKFNVHPLFKNINRFYFYFVHSYYFEVIDKNHVHPLLIMVLSLQLQLKNKIYLEYNFI